MKTTSGILAVALLTCAAHAQNSWTNVYNGPGNYDDEPKAVGVDISGNVFVTGFSFGSGTGYDYTTIKYSNAGAPLWTNRYDAGGADLATAIAVDADGNVFVTGSSSGDGGGGPYDYATIKYSNSGVPLWTNRFNGTGDNDDRARAVAVDANGDVFVTGYSDSTGSSYDFVTIGYSSAGVPLWTNKYNGPGNLSDQANAIAVDDDGNVFVTGASQGSSIFSDYATIAYSNSGLPLWTNRYDGPLSSQDGADAIKVDGNGDVLVTGLTTGFNHTFDYATVKYSGAGAPLWTNLFTTGNADNSANVMVVDTNNNVFVAGHSRGNDLIVHYLTIKYSSGGVPIWTNYYVGPGSGIDEVTGAAADTIGNVYVTGFSVGSGTDYDFATIGYSGTGVTLWTNRYAGTPIRNYAPTIAMDGSDNVFVSGYSYDGNNISTADWVTIKYGSSSVSPIPLGFQLVVGQLILTWSNPAFSLQSAPTVTGTFTNITGAISPYTNSITAGQQFFRLISN